MKPLDYLSPHFQLFELMRTGHTDVDNTPPPEVIAQLMITAAALWEPLRVKWGQLWVDDGYRCPQLNLEDHGVGGADVTSDHISAHVLGCAADLVPLTAGVTPMLMLGWLIGTPLPFDQAIAETSINGGKWLHLAGVRPGHETTPRRQALVSLDGRTFLPFPGA